MESLPFTHGSLSAEGPRSLRVIPQEEQQRSNGPSPGRLFLETGQDTLTGIPLHRRGKTWLPS